MEAETNEFSAEMLMPEPLFRRDMRKKVSPGLEHIIDWPDRYETSTLATVRRSVDFSDTPSAMVCSRDGVVEFAYRNRNAFPLIELRQVQPIPNKSLTLCFFGSGDGCSDTDETEPALWISGELRRGATMYEQVLVQGKGYRITLLTIDEDEAEDEDDEDAGERAEWNPTYHRR